MEHFNKLTPPELERLAILVEEAAEVQQIAMKIMRHGYESHHPDDPNYNNRNLLEKEISHFQYITNLMMISGDINNDSIEAYRRKKAQSIQQYLHHQ